MTDEPQWLELLRKSCAASTQRDVAARLDMSATTVNLVLNGKYDSSTSGIEARVMERLAPPPPPAPPSPPPEPDWLIALREACDAMSQRSIAELLEVSTGVINQVLAGKYKASTRRIEQRVRGAIMGETVQCPVFGEVTRANCQSHQDRPLKRAFSGNPLHAAVYRACRQGCPNSLIGLPGVKPTTTTNNTEESAS